MLTLVYHPNRWRQRDTHMYQLVGRLLDAQHLLLVELTYRTDARGPTIERVGVYAPRMGRDEASWELVYDIPPLVITLVEAPVQLECAA